QGLGRESLSVSTSTSLLHVPYTVELETSLPVDVASWLSFAEEKVTEVEALATAVTAGPDARVDAFNRADRARRTRTESARVHSPAVRERTAATAGQDGFRTDFTQRRQAQDALGIPDLPTT